MTREEALVFLGVDSSTVPAGLGTATTYAKKWVDDVKSEETKYTSWWSTELKKREDLEIASSVRAASRSIQARRLLRERETARTAAANAEQAAANTIIGQGSMPAGWAEQAARRQAAIELEQKAAEALKGTASAAHGSAGAFREFMVVVREGTRGDFTRMFGSMTRLLGMLGLGIGQMTGIGIALAEIAAIVIEFKKMRDAQKEERESEKRLDEGQQLFTNNLIANVKNLEKAGRISAQESTNMQDRLLYYNSSEVRKSAAQFIRSHGGVVSDQDLKEMQRLDEEHAKKMEDNRRNSMYAYQREMDDQEKIAALKREMEGLEKTTVEYKKKQLELDDLQRLLIKDQKDHEEDKLRIHQKQLEQQRIYTEAQLRLNDIQQREREKFMPTLEELAHHGRFGAQARSIGRLERRIKRDLERGDVGGADRDIAERNKIYDSLADRGVVAERADRREIRDLTAKMQLHIAAIAQGKAPILVVPQMK